MDKLNAVVHSCVSGSIVLKSFLNGSPEMRLGLNEDLIIHSLGISRSR
jgi:hypothetical protein